MWRRNPIGVLQKMTGSFVEIAGSNRSAKRTRNESRPPSPRQLPAMERLRSIGEWWAEWTHDERREGLSVLFQSIDVDVELGEGWVNPWPEFAGLFESRVLWCLQSIFSRNEGLLAYPGRYGWQELVA